MTYLFNPPFVIAAGIIILLVVASIDTTQKMWSDDCNFREFEEYTIKK